MSVGPDVLVKGDRAVMIPPVSTEQLPQLVPPRRGEPAFPQLTIQYRCHLHRRNAGDQQRPALSPPTQVLHSVGARLGRIVSLNQRGGVEKDGRH